MTELSPAARRLLNSAVEHDGPSPRHRKNLEQKIARAASAAALTWAAQSAAEGSTAANVANSTAANVATHVAPLPTLAASGSAGTTASSASLTASSVKGLAAVATAKTLGSATPWLIAASVTTALATPLLVQSSTSDVADAASGLTGAAHPGLSAPASSQREHGEPSVNVPPHVATSTAAPALLPVTAPPHAVAPNAPDAPNAPPRAKAATSKAATEKTADRKDSVALELALLGRARTALRTGDGAKALALLDEHARSFAGGQLSAERQAVRVLALCSLGRTSDAQQVAHQFFAQHQHSPLTQRLHSSCISQEITSPSMTGSASPGNE